MVIVAIPLIILPLFGYGRVVRRLSRARAGRAGQRLGLCGGKPRRAAHHAGLHLRADGRSAAIAAPSRSPSGPRARASAPAPCLTAAATFLVFGSIVGILWFGAHEVLAGAMTGGRLAQFVLYAAFAAGSVAVLSEVWGEMQQAVGAAERLGEIMAVEPEIVSPANPKPLPEPARGEIRFDDVSFVYPTRARHAGVRGSQLFACARRADRHRRPVGRGQDHDLQPDHALLRSAAAAAC